MHSTESSNPPPQFISPELLDELISEYQRACGGFYDTQRDLLSEPDHQIIRNLQVAHGMGHILKTIMTRIPEEVIRECPIRQSVFYSLTGSQCRGHPSTGTGRVSASSGSGQGFVKTGPKPRGDS